MKPCLMAMAILMPMNVLILLWASLVWKLILLASAPMSVGEGMIVLVLVLSSIFHGGVYVSLLYDM